MSASTLGTVQGNREVRIVTWIPSVPTGCVILTMRVQVVFDSNMDMESQVWKASDYDAAFLAATVSLPATPLDTVWEESDPPDGSRTDSKESELDATQSDSGSKQVAQRQAGRHAYPDTPSSGNSGSSDEDEFVVVSAPDATSAAEAASSTSSISSYFGALYSSTNTLRRGVMSSHEMGRSKRSPQVSAASRKRTAGNPLVTHSPAMPGHGASSANAGGSSPSRAPLSKKRQSFSGHSKVMLVAVEEAGRESGAARVPRWRIPIPRLRIVIMAVGTR
jgi:hypothetical protein